MDRIADFCIVGCVLMNVWCFYLETLNNTVSWLIEFTGIVDHWGHNPNLLISRVRAMHLPGKEISTAFPWGGLSDCPPATGCRTCPTGTSMKMLKSWLGLCPEFRIIQSWRCVMWLATGEHNGFLWLCFYFNISKLMSLQTLAKSGTKLSFLCCLNTVLSPNTTCG